MYVRYPDLKRICTLDTYTIMGELSAKYRGELVSNAYGNEYLYVDNGSNVLGVAHLDTVLDHREAHGRAYLHVPYKELVLVGHKAHKRVGCPTLLSKSVAVQCITLDDRLGVWTLTNLLPARGIKLDWLFTTGEEVGRSTAFDFVPPKQYNWVCSFDRRGFSPVLYQYDSSELRGRLAAHGMNTTLGSYSDIADVTAGCVGINFGCAYDLEHTDRCVASIDSLKVSLKRFASFYRAYSDTHMPYTNPVYSSHDEFASNYEDGSEDTIDWNAVFVDLTGVRCELCDNPAEIDASTKDTPGYYLCKQCYQEDNCTVVHPFTKLDNCISWDYTICAMCGKHTRTSWDRHLACFVCDACHKDLYG